MSAKAKETAKHEVERMAAVAQQGAQSGAYLYPLKVPYRPLGYQPKTTSDKHS